MSGGCLTLLTTVKLVCFHVFRSTHSYSLQHTGYPNFIPNTIYKLFQITHNKTYFQIQIKHKKTLFPFETAIKNLSNTISLTLETSCSLSNSILYVTEDLS